MKTRLGHTAFSLVIKSTRVRQKEGLAFGLCCFWTSTLIFSLRRWVNHGLLASWLDVPVGQKGCTISTMDYRGG